MITILNLQKLPMVLGLKDGSGLRLAPRERLEVKGELITDEFFIAQDLGYIDIIVDNPKSEKDKDKNRKGGK